MIKHTLFAGRKKFFAEKGMPADGEIQIRGGAPMGTPYNGQNKDTGGIGIWIVSVVLMLTPLWPVGLVMFLWKLLGPPKRRANAGPWHTGEERKSPRQEEHHTPVHSVSRQGKPVDLNWGRGLTVGGMAVLLVSVIVLACILPPAVMDKGLLSALVRFLPAAGSFAVVGAAMAIKGARRTKKARRWYKYLALVGKRERISLTALAQAMPVSLRRARSDLQEMLERGIFASGYLDMSRGQLVLSEEGVEDPPPEPQQTEPRQEREELDMTDENAVLAEIQRINRVIAHPEVSRKIDRIGEITGKIFAYQKQNPAEKSQLRSFLNYYLPTTLKILNTYAQMEQQGADGENIRAAKARVEGMLDKVAEGFEKQLNRLYQNDAIDVTADVEVLERMLEKDGLSGGSGGATLGG
jgi:hypothetical protein